MNNHFVLERSATHYEISVSYNNNVESRLFKKYIISVLIGDLTECFAVDNLENVADEIFYQSKRLSVVDSINIHNCIAENLRGLPKAIYDNTKPIKIHYV